jgi:hypothetical protein
MSNYKTPFGKFTKGALPEERYSFDRYYCPGCKQTYKTYFTFKIPSQFMNTPEKSYNLKPIWSCPNGCTYRTSSEVEYERVPYELAGKCNPNKKGKNCFTKFTYVQPFDPNYANPCLRPSENRADPLYGVENGSFGINNNIASNDHDVLLEPFEPMYDRKKHKDQRTMSEYTDEIEQFSAPYTLTLDTGNLMTNNMQTCGKKNMNSGCGCRTANKNCRCRYPKNNLPIYAQNNYNDNNYGGYMGEIDWVKRAKQVCPNPYDIWARRSF